MAKEIIVKKKNLPAEINGIYDLSEQELDDLFRSSAESNNSEKNSLGYKLFDANGNSKISDKERIEMIARLTLNFQDVLDTLRFSPSDPNVTHTPYRIAKMLVNELFSGRFEKAPDLTVFPNRKKVDELIISKGIDIMSVCSHHWQTISGECAIGYIPNDHVIGLSKLSRITDWFSRRGQIQEELGEQIADYLEDLLKPKALGVVIKAKHYCMIARGVRSPEERSKMVTSVMRGLLLEESELRNEFLKLIDD